MAEGDQVVVIGGGAIGVSAAFYLAQEGLFVTLLERGEICSGCSYGNAGLVVPSHSVPLASPGALAKGLRWMLDPESPFHIRPRASLPLLSWLWRFGRAARAARVRRAVPVLGTLGHASLGLYRELAALDELSFGYEQKGLLAVYRTAEGFEDGRREAALLGAGGLRATVVDAAGARAIEPRLGPDVVGGVFYPDDAHLRPDLLVTGLARAAEARGARLRTGTEVLGFRTRGRTVTTVETTRGDVEADTVVLAAGSWSRDVARSLGLRLPIEPAKGYSVTCRAPEGTPGLPLLLGEARVAVTPMGPLLRFAGTLELAGFDLAINRRRVAAVRRAPGRYLPGLGELPPLEVWRGLRPCTPDGLPLLGRSRGFDNLVLATGHATIGVSLAPITGKVVAQLVAGKDPGLDLALLDPRRFA